MQTQRRAASAHLLGLRKERVRTVKDCRGETKLFLSPGRTVSPRLPHFLWQGTPSVPLGIRVIVRVINGDENRKFLSHVIRDLLMTHLGGGAK